MRTSRGSNRVRHTLTLVGRSPEGGYANTSWICGFLRSRSDQELATENIFLTEMRCLFLPCGRDKHNSMRTGTGWCRVKQAWVCLTSYFPRDFQPPSPAHGRYTYNSMSTPPPSSNCLLYFSSSGGKKQPPYFIDAFLQRDVGTCVKVVLSSVGTFASFQCVCVGGKGYKL